MENTMRFIQRVAFATGLICFLAGLALVLSGCSMARGPGGEIIVGIPVGVLVETGEQALIGAAGMIPVVGPFIQNLLLGAGASGLTVAGVSKMARVALEKRQAASLEEAERKRKSSDRAREELRVEVAELKAEKEARES